MPGYFVGTEDTPDDGDGAAFVPRADDAPHAVRLWASMHMVPRDGEHVVKVWENKPFAYLGKFRVYVRIEYSAEKAAD